MKKITRIVAGVSTAALLFAPGVALADPGAEKPAPAPVVEAPTEYVKVLILTHNQPTRPGAEMLNLREVNKVRDLLVEKYGIKPDRSFGYLVKGFAAQIPVDKWADIAAEPTVASVERTVEYKPLMGTAGDLTFSTQARQEHGISGEGIVIAVIDTGIDMSHESMKLDPGAKTKLAPAAGFTAKVPWGYNYADDNTEVNDLTGNEHGMHVAGISAANGGKDANVIANRRINGIAPNAQVLALKVFSNSPDVKGKGASTEDIIAALEDAVKHDADIINMSLGSTNGFAGTSGEARAVKLATDQGIEVVVAAANDGVNFSPQGNSVDAFGLFDDGTVGSPATGDTALAVASIDNVSATVQAARVSSGATNFVLGYDAQQGKADGQPHKIVYGELGKPDQIPAEAAGNYVLIQRGEITFAEKVENALAKGAIGVVIYNHATGGDAVPGMAGLEGFDTFVGALGHSDGERLRKQIVAGETQVAFTTDLVQLPSVTAKTPSDFTSWGTDSSLAFRPHLAGIGGNVWSAQNGNTYASSSGTSMAAPHVAGAAALVLEKNKAKFPGLSRLEQAKWNRIALANTSQILVNESGVPFSARVMGAGLINTKAAIDTEVFATVDGSPWVALKEITAPESFTITLTNRGNTERVYNTGATCAVNETNVPMQETTSVCNDAETIVASAPTVTVPANGTATVTYTVTPDTSSVHWLSGWAKLTPATNVDTTPQLVVPFLGFVGDWNAERIFDAPAGKDALYDALYNDPAENTDRTGLVSPTGPRTKARSTNAAFWISPNGDGVRDTVHPVVVSLRNAWKVRGSIVNESGTVVREVGIDNHIRRNTLQDLISGEASPSNELLALAFDGHVYNKKTGNFEPIAEGNYSYRLEAQLSAEFAPQKYDFELSVDTTAPTLEVGAPAANQQQDVVIAVNASDARSGLEKVEGLLNGSATKVPAVKVAEGKYEITVPAAYVDQVDFVEVVATDFAGNTTADQATLLENPFLLDDVENWAEPTVGANAKSAFYGDLIVKDGQRRLSGKVIDGVEKLYLNDVLVPLNEKAFDTTIPVQDAAKTQVVLRAEGPSLNTAVDLSFTYDSQIPELSLTGVEYDADFGFYYVERKPDGTVHLEGKVVDANSTISELEATFLGAQEPEVHNFTGGSFTWDLAVPEHFGVLTLAVNDGINEHEIYVRVLNAGFNRDGNIVYGDLKVKGFNLADRNDETVSLKNGKYFYTWEGILASIPSRMEIDGKEVAFDKKTGGFVAELPLEQGINAYNLKLYDLNNDLVYDTSVKVFFDSVIPVYTLEEGKPAIHADGAIYLKEAGDIQFKGNVSDNAFGYALALNGNVLEYILNEDDPTLVANQRNFDTTVAAEDGDIFFLGLYDQAGNFIERKIPVVVDKVAPVLTVNGVEKDAVYKVGTATDKITKQVTVETTDANLANLRVLVDGELVATKVVKAVPHPLSALVQEGDTVEGQDGGTGNTPKDPKHQAGEETVSETTSNTDLAADKETDKATENKGAVSEEAIEKAVTARQNENQAELLKATSVGAEKPETALTVTVEVQAGPGKHVVAVESEDKVGNLAIAETPFTVEVDPNVAPKDTEVKAEAKTPVVALSAVGMAPQGTTFSLKAVESGNTATFTAKSAPVVFKATYTLSPAKAVAKVELVATDGALTIVKAVEKDGKLVFEADSNAVIKVTYKTKQVNPGSGGTTPGKTPGKPGIPNTGSNAATFAVASALFLAAGATFVAVRRRKTA